MALSGAEVIFNLSASDDVIGKYGYLRELVLGQSSRCLCGYVYSGAGFGESSTDLVFDGKGMIAENGHMLAEKPRWDNDARITVADIDIEALRHDRLHNTTYGDCREREVPGYSSHGADYDFPLSDEGAAASRKPLRRINPLPFLPPMMPAERSAARISCRYRAPDCAGVSISSKVASWWWASAAALTPPLRCWWPSEPLTASALTVRASSE